VRRRSSRGGVADRSILLIATFGCWRDCPLKDGIDPKIRIALVFKLDDAG